MTAPSLEVVFDALAGASIAGGVVALGVWALCACIGRLPAAARCTLWWLVSLKLLVGLTSIEPVAVPVLPPASATLSVLSAPATTRATTQLIEGPVAGTLPWRAALAVTWLGGLVVVAAFAVGQWRRMSSLGSRTRPADTGLVSLVDELSERSGLRLPPEVRVSDEIDAPLVTGLMRPVVIVPSRRWPTLTALQQRMAICHELQHVRRGDLWLGLAPSVAERLFFFHPLAHLAAREYVIAREAACDAAVLRVLDAEPHDYGRLLVTLGVAPLPGAVSASGAPHSFSSLKRRIGMLNLGAPTLAHRLAGWALAAVALAGLLPLELVARPATASVAEQQEAPGPKMRTPGSGFEYRLVLTEKDGTFESGNFDGEDYRHDGPGLWFRLGGRNYEVRDAVSIEQARAIVKPVAEIGRQQGEIGAKQGLIGAQQGIVGAKQGEVGARQGAIGAQQGLLGARQGVLGARQAADLTDAEKEQIAKEQQRIDREMQELNAKMAALDKEMREVSSSMPDWNGEMAKLSRQMDVLSRKMTEASAKADAEMQVLVDKLIKLGTAKPIK